MYNEAMGELTARLTDALAEGQNIIAQDRLDHVMLGLRFGLMSRATAVGILADSPPARAAMYDCVRAMCEAVAQVTWITASPVEMLSRSGCIELGQAKADANNRRKLLAVHKVPRISEENRGSMLERLKDSDETVDRVRAQHGKDCPNCHGKGRDAGHAAAWIHECAIRGDATTAQVNLYSIWVGCSAEAHQLTPQRHSREDGNHLDLPDELADQAVAWAMELLLSAAPLIAFAVRMSALEPTREVLRWWSEVLLSSLPWLRAAVTTSRTPASP
jgi:hypothetical protein